jgi:hypothetical protein
MSCWICHHQVVSIVGETVGTCSQCWIHACDDHSERPSGSKFQCAIETAKILYASLVFGSPAAVPMGASTAAGRGAQLAFDDWGPGSRMWELSAQHREYWRRRIRRVLERAVADGHSPWFGRELPHDSAALTKLADLAGLVAWYLGLGAQDPYPSVRTAGRLMREGHAEPTDFAEFDTRQDEPYERSGADPLVLAWLFDRLRITPAEVVYLLRYYAKTDEPRQTTADWGLGVLYERMQQNPFPA